MLDKPLEQINYADLDQFVKEQWPEGKRVDYKRETYGGRDEDKKELLKDASSFANTQGGDILIGVSEDKGVPASIPGVALADVDKEKLRLDESIRRGIEPRIEFGIHHIPTDLGTIVLVIRVEESMVFPHRVVFQGRPGEFFARNSAGKYSMDTSELRLAFTLSETIYEKIRAFHQNRISQVMRGETPVSLPAGGKIILHLIPVESFRSRLTFDVKKMSQLPSQFPPIGCNTWDYRLNLDGHVCFTGGRTEKVSWSYTQFFRNGVVEVVLANVVQETKDTKLLLAGNFERPLLFDFKRLLNGYKQISVSPPIWGFLTVTGVKGARIPTESYCPDNHFSVDRDILDLPEFLIENLEVETSELLRPTFDLVWNASGLARSYNFDEKGGWTKG